MSILNTEKANSSVAIRDMAWLENKDDQAYTL